MRPKTDKGVGAISPEIGPKFNSYYRAMKCFENVFMVMPFNKAYLKLMYIERLSSKNSAKMCHFKGIPKKCYKMTYFSWFSEKMNVSELQEDILSEHVICVYL